MTTLIQRSFAGGEIAPALYARIDQSKYQSGLRICRNSIVMRHGGETNRPGTVFVGEVKDSTKRVRLLPFVFNADQTYVLEFGNLYMRVHRAGTQESLTGQAISAVTNAATGVVTYVGADTYANGSEVYISGIVGPIGNYLNGRNFKVAGVNTGANTFQLNYLDGTAVDTTAMGAYTSGGTLEAIYEIATPYLEADLPTIKFVQSADVLTLVHPDYAPRELARTGHTSWTLTAISFVPTQPAPTGVAVSGGSGAVTYTYHITAINDETFEESLAVIKTQTGLTTAASMDAHTITWTLAAGASEYNVYQVDGNGVPGLIGVARGTTFVNPGITPDPTDTPPSAREPFGIDGSDDCPSCVGYYQQRQAFGNTNNDPEKIWLSRISAFHNFTVSSPLQDDDAITFSLAGKQVNAIKHLIELGKFVPLTSAGEWTVEGDSSGIISPTSINPKQQSYNGTGDLAPIIVGNNALYVQARGSIIRDLTFDYQVDGYRGNDLTIFSAHLVDGYELVDWTYQQIPHSVVWVVRDDGVLLGLTYVREQQILAWHRHDFDGEVENVCSVPEGTEDAVYVVVKRTVGGATKRYVERMAPRQITDVRYATFMDAALSYDGTNDTGTTMTLSGGSTWNSDELLTLTASASYFDADDVNDAIFLESATGEVIRFTILNYSSATVVTGRAHKDVPANLQATARTTWTRAIRTIRGLWHLEGKDISILGDGFVVASPNNDAYTVVTVTNGAAVLDKPYGIIQAGLPILADIETLDMDTTQGETMADKKKMVGQVTVYLEASRGLWVGGRPPLDDSDDPQENLTELKIRNEEGYDDPIALQTGTVEVRIQTEWNSNGRIFIRQIDPLPISVLAVAPSGFIPIRG